MYFYTTYKSPIGKLTLAGNENALMGLWIEGQKYFGNRILEYAKRKDELSIFIDTQNWLDRYFEGKKPQIQELSISLLGSDFQKEVWKLLCDIPYGTTVTYGMLAKKTAKKLGKISMSSQAVGGAVGHNPISIIIPCHRVVGANGSLTGYAAGIEVKRELLMFEGIKTVYKGQI